MAVGMRTTLDKHPLIEDMNWFIASSRPHRVRTMRQFAEQEVVIPDGPFAGRRFRCHRQPYTGLWFDAVDSGRWNRYVATGPTQSGKSLSCFVIPVLYHLFEMGETVICGLPDMDMAADKWRESLLPVIDQSRFRDLLPRTGSGSRGASKVDVLQFRNGATLKFMSGGGGDKSRAGFTSRVLVVTETDGLDEVAGGSRESDKVTQLEARTRAFGNRKRVYLECTVSTEEGRTWIEYQHGTASSILMPCPHCNAYVAPEREQLTGWHGAESQVDARRTGAFTCPTCGEFWTEDDRRAANLAGVLVHRGQQVEADGTVSGELPSTSTLGFRWSAINNLFVTAGDVAADQWRASRAVDEENAEREMRQFVWCLPAIPTKWDQTRILSDEIARRVRHVPRGFLPPEAEVVTAAVDLGKYLLHWIVTAWSADATGHIVDYGRIEVASDDLGVEPGILNALRQLRDMLLAGFPQQGNPGAKPQPPKQVWIDAGYMAPVVYSFCREAGSRFRPAFGRGTSQQRTQWYNRPTNTGSVVKLIGEGYHFNMQPAERMLTVEVDADYWKTWVHERLVTPLGSPGALTLYSGTPQEHLAISKHLTAETKTEEFVAGKGLVVKWERQRRQNHWFDALYNASAAGRYSGAKLIHEVARKRQQGGRAAAAQGQPGYTVGAHSAPAFEAARFE